MDLAIRVGVLEDSSLVARPIAHVARGLYAAPEYLVQAPALETPADLQAHRYLGLLHRHDPLSFENWSAPTPQPAETPLRTNSLNFMRHMAGRGFGIVRLPRFYAEPLIETGRLRPVLSDYPVPSVALSALYPSRRHLNQRTRLFVDHLIRELQDHPWASRGLIRLPG
ncbi:substrate binding domain-containing protein [Marinobacterium aestuariivivens]|uniref:Substrate binding domain-containing protein n=1 Tax=Marinobacterium aestuariivivens TaxID=1698799 RepID=A0ABW2A863_9GAMM